MISRTSAHARLLYVISGLPLLTMRLPIKSMHSLLVRHQGAAEDSWLRSMIVDFEPGRELVILVPFEKPRETSASEDQPEPESSEPSEHDENSEAATAATPESGEAPETAPEIPDDDVFVEEPPFTTGTWIEVEISFPDGIRRFESVVRRLDPSFGGCLRISWPTEGTRIQRRDYVRVGITRRVTVRMVDAETGSLLQVVGTTIDLSAGGARLRLSEPIPDDTRIEVQLDVPALKAQTLQGRVVRSGELETKRNEPPAHWVAVEYVGVDEGLRNELTQLVFDIQREQMRKSVG